MLFFSRWKAISVLLTAIVICLFAVPNFFPDRVVQRWPAWAQRHIVLGLDLQGGSHLLLEVDSNAVRKEKVQTLLDDVRRLLREARIGYTGLVARGDSVEVRIREGADPQGALAKLRELSQPIGGALGGGGQRTVNIADLGGGLIRLTLTPAAITERIRQSVDQSIQIVERRVKGFGPLGRAYSAKASTVFWSRCRDCKIRRISRTSSARPQSSRSGWSMSPSAPTRQSRTGRRRIRKSSRTTIRFRT